MQGSVRTAICMLLPHLSAVAYSPITRIRGSSHTTTTEQLLQFTLAGHVLSSDSHDITIAGGDHMLKVKLAGIKKIRPEVDATAEKVAFPLS